MALLLAETLCGLLFILMSHVAVVGGGEGEGGDFRAFTTAKIPPA